jgi:hypothetical protein
MLTGPFVLMVPQENFRMSTGHNSVLRDGQAFNWKIDVRPKSRHRHLL